MPVTDVPKFERFFRAAGRVDVDKHDLKRFDEFVHRKLYDMLLLGVAAAAANGRDVVEPQDLPVTKGLQERTHEFAELDEDLGLEPVLGRLAAWPPLDLALSQETQDRLPGLIGGLSVALARTFRIVDPDVANPQTEQWERAMRLFDLLL